MMDLDFFDSRAYNIHDSFTKVQIEEILIWKNVRLLLLDMEE